MNSAELNVINSIIQDSKLMVVGDDLKNKVNRTLLYGYNTAHELFHVQGESVNILLNFTQFFETRIEYRFQIFTAHSCDFLLPSYARLA